MKTIIAFDYDKLNDAVKKLDVELSMQEFLDFLKSIHSESDIQTAYAYVGINPKLPHIKDKTIDELWRTGYIVRTVLGDNYGINFISDTAQAITLDLLRAVYENNATNIIIVSNSHKLEDLVVALKEKDISVETVFYGSLMDYDLAVKSSGFINLEDFISDDGVNDEVNDEVNSINNDGDSSLDQVIPIINDHSKQQLAGIAEDEDMNDLYVEDVETIPVKTDDLEKQIIKNEGGKN